MTLLAPVAPALTQLGVLSLAWLALVCISPRVRVLVPARRRWALAAARMPQPRLPLFSTLGPSDVIDIVRPDLEVTMDSRNDLYPVAQFEFDKALTDADWHSRPGVRGLVLLAPGN